MMQQCIARVNLAADNAFVHASHASKADPRAILRQLMTDRGFTSHRALAAAAEVSQPTLSRYLDGTTDDMSLPTWRALAAALEVTLAELLGESPILSDGTRALRRHLQTMEQLPQEQQEAIIETAKRLAESHARRR